ncbi:hypothetical protein M011DRAFT_401537 [Sporormia fimetaria CBS 119925]|uniref:Cyclin-L2 n=1 Tax=Sporormia fimetaria CBS 119925 TaxID=1340428 RepID=A0A6A6VET5_9PLEO|nr:hypothetical protein M011DRAFT_401537 [Sporormia fimetaria CBS 119925]
MEFSPLANPLATVAQLETSNSQFDGLPADLEKSIRFAGARLTQAAGILLRLPQEVIAQAILIFMRYWLGPEAGSLHHDPADVVSAASIYLAAKTSAYQKSARSVINVYAFLDSIPTTYTDLSQLPEGVPYVSESTYTTRKRRLFSVEVEVLESIGFQITFTLPYTLCFTYLQALDAFTYPRGQHLARRAMAHLNTGLLSPQFLYLTHQPHALAVAAIYLAAREVGVKLPGVEWWEVFDVDREELGFLVVGFLSVGTFAAEEKKYWGTRKVPMTVAELDEELDVRRVSSGNASLEVDAPQNSSTGVSQSGSPVGEC